MPGIAPAALHALGALARDHSCPPVPVVSGESAGFRLRARLAIRGRLNSPKIGLFEQNSHRVVHIPKCSVQHPLINRVAEVVRRALVDTRVPSYSDGAHLGIARYLQVVVERSSQTAQVVLVANCAESGPLGECLELIRARLGAELHSLWWSGNVERGNTILGPRIEHWCGPKSVVEHFGGAAVHYPPGAFGQNNLDIADRIVGHLGEAIPADSRVAEFYAGVGAIGLSLLDRLGEIRMNEASAHSLVGLQMGLAALDAPARAKISVMPGPAAEACAAARDADVVIADPPRKGLDPELTRQLIAQPPQRFLYVSCGLESFLADTAELTVHGTLRLVSVSAFNLLPFTDHVETVACFERRHV